MGVIPSRRRIRARDGLTSTGFGEQQTQGGLAAVPERTIGGVGIEGGDIVCAARVSKVVWDYGCLGVGFRCYGLEWANERRAVLLCMSGRNPNPINVTLTRWISDRRCVKCMWRE